MAVATAILLVLGMAVGPGAACAADGDEHVARIRLRVVDAVNQETRVEIERARAGLASSAEVARLEEKLQEGSRLAADLRTVRAVRPRGAGSESRIRSAGDGGSEKPSGGTAFQAARAALPHTPVGVLSLVGGGALALVGGGVAAAVLRQPRKKAQ
ncbi:hypothetical protein GCM10010289_78840 [Streptomyces violascens]|uniref:Secreted protein n=2 Tax=Streptomyces violascens TaxID=67381 RepID=A0ABQ3R151_9ACTN|nr:hypothetical protein GCM10010289_78840 [Streptomyces violascens]GHI43242.1 hypothetical protein Sviol_76500 [Streptomyces violascens]